MTDQQLYLIAGITFGILAIGIGVLIYALKKDFQRHCEQTRFYLGGRQECFSVDLAKRLWREEVISPWMTARKMISVYDDQKWADNDAT